MSEPKPFANLPRGLAPFGYRDFLLYWIGVATTNTGRWIELTGLLWLVYELTDSPFLVGLLGAARALPALVLSPVAGVVADRVDQRILLFTTQSLSLLLSLVLGLLVVTGVIELWHIYAQVVAQTIVNCFDVGTRQTLFPRLVPRSVLPGAVTLNVTAARVSKLIGPASGGFLIAAFGEASPFFVNAVTYLALMGAVLCMPPLPPFAREKASSLGNDLTSGLRYILSTPVLSGMFKLELVFGLCEMNPAMIAIISREILNAGPQELGLLLSAPAFGSIIAIGWLLFFGRAKRQGRLTILCTLAYCAVLTAIAFSPNYLATFIALNAIGILEVIVAVTRSTVVQLAAPGHMRGRVMGNMGMVTRGTGPLSETQSGVLTSVMGANLALLAAAAAIAAAASVTAIYNRELWRFSLDETSQNVTE